MKTFHNSKKVTIDGILFDSKLEAQYYIDHKNSNEFKIINIHPSYILQEKNKNKWLRAITYETDFDIQYPDWKIVTIDIKWQATETSKLKRKLYLFRYETPKLLWLCKYKWEWVDYFDNQKRISKAKKDKKKL